MKKTILILFLLTALVFCSACSLFRQSGDGSGKGNDASADSAAADKTPAGTAGDAAGSDTAADLTAAIEGFRTIGDVRAVADTDNYQTATYDDLYVYVFRYDGTDYRVTAPIPADTRAVLDTLDIFDPDYNEKNNAALDPLVIETRENVSAMIPTKAELDQLIGKTGADLLDDGWYSMGYNVDEMTFFLAHGMFQYTVVFNGKLTYTDDFDEYEAIRPLTIKSVTYDCLADATNLD